MRAWLFAAVAILAIPISAQEPTSIAILREDGFLVPIVTISGSRYRPLLVPSTLKDNTNVFGDGALALARSQWRVSLTDGKELTVQTLNRAMVHNHCSFEEAWRTSFKGRPVEPHIADIGKLGIAVRGATATQPENVTSVPDDSSRRIARLAMDLAAAMERDRLTSDPEMFKDYILPKDGVPPIRITKLFRYSSDAVTTTYFFETSRGEYPLMTTGWIVDSPGGRVAHDVTFSINDDTHKDGRTATVVGIVRLPTEVLWLLEWHGYEWENLVIHGWPSGQVRFEAPGAGC